MNDAAKIYQLYMENAVAANEQPQMQVFKNGDKEWRLHGELHREDGPAIELANGDKSWWLHGKIHRNNGPAMEIANGNKLWFLHGKLHREDGPAIESANNVKQWCLNDVRYPNADAWAKAVLKMHNKPNNDAAVQKFVRMILTKDDLL